MVLSNDNVFKITLIPQRTYFLLVRNIRPFRLLLKPGLWTMDPDPGPEPGPWTLDLDPCPGPRPWTLDPENPEP